MTGEVKANVKAASDAMADLYIFSAIVAILEGGCVHAETNVNAAKIIKICRAQMQASLRQHDTYAAKIIRISAHD